MIPVTVRAKWGRELNLPCHYIMGAPGEPTRRRYRALIVRWDHEGIHAVALKIGKLTLPYESLDLRSLRDFEDTDLPQLVRDTR